MARSAAEFFRQHLHLAGFPLDDADACAVRSVVELVDNAIDAVARRDAPTIRVRLEAAAASAAGSWAVLTVIDNGDGFPHEGVDRLTGSFFASMKRGQESIGTYGCAHYWADDDTGGGLADKCHGGSQDWAQGSVAKFRTAQSSWASSATGAAYRESHLPQPRSGGSGRAHGDGWPDSGRGLCGSRRRGRALHDRCDWLTGKFACHGEQLEHCDAASSSLYGSSRLGEPAAVHPT